MTNRKKVLIIDDSKFICSILSENLSDNGFEVIICNDGNCGVKMAQEQIPDIIILDLILPELPGEEVCRQIRRNPKTETIPVIMLTAKNNEVDEVIGRVLGANAYMPKPFRMEELLAQIQSLIFTAIFFLITLF